MDFPVTLSTKLRISVSNGAKPADFYGFFPCGFQGVAFVFLGFRGSSISESQIKTLPTKTGGQGMATAHIFQTIKHVIRLNVLNDKNRWFGNIE
jgi:hypothetical protein